jgi:hypothetical protein
MARAELREFMHKNLKKKMNLEERARAWRNAWGWADPDEDYKELAKDEPRPTLLYIEADDHVYSPLGYALRIHNYAGKAIPILLERGADPLEPACKLRNEHWCDAFVVARTPKTFSTLLDYAMPMEGEWYPQPYMSLIADKRQQLAAGVAWAWCVAQIQRDDLIEPVVQRLASISLKRWKTPAPTPREPVSKKLKK